MHDCLLEIMNHCIVKTDYNQLKDKKHILVIAVNEEARIREFLVKLEEINFKGKITFYAQPKMVPILKDMLPNATVREWQGAYTQTLAKDIMIREEQNRIDAFMFFCGQSSDLRNRNIMEIAETLHNNGSLQIYSIDADDELHEHTQVDIYNKATHLYMEMNNLLEIYYERGCRK